MMTTRRSFLKGAIAASAAASVPTLSKTTPEKLVEAAAETFTPGGFGLAPLKPEGGSYSLDPYPDQWYIKDRFAKLMTRVDALPETITDDIKTETTA
jgi:hypothetical protein